MKKLLARLVALSGAFHLGDSFLVTIILGVAHEQTRAVPALGFLTVLMLIYALILVAGIIKKTVGRIS